MRISLLILISLLALITQSAHAANECPDIKGVYTGIDNNVFSLSFWVLPSKSLGSNTKASLAKLINNGFMSINKPRFTCKDTGGSTMYCINERDGSKFDAMSEGRFGKSQGTMVIPDRNGNLVSIEMDTPTFITKELGYKVISCRNKIATIYQLNNLKDPNTGFKFPFSLLIKTTYPISVKYYLNPSL